MNEKQIKIKKPEILSDIFRINVGYVHEQSSRRPLAPLPAALPESPTQAKHPPWSPLSLPPYHYPKGPCRPNIVVVHQWPKLFVVPALTTERAFWTTMKPYMNGIFEEPEVMSSLARARERRWYMGVGGFGCSFVSVCLFENFTNFQR